MLRTILGVVLGLVVGLLVIFTVEGVGHTLFPPDAEVNLTDPNEMAQVMSHVSREAKVMILLAWTLGLLFAAGAANLIAGRRAPAGRITALVLLAFGVWTMVVTSYPLWLTAGSLAGGLLGAFLADRAFGKPRA
jgi:hypothetical protein